MKKAPRPLLHFLVLLLSLLSAALVLLLLPGCKSSPPSRPRVVVSIYPLFDLARRVAGPDAEVSLLLSPGKSEHGFERTPQAVEAAGRAQLGIMVGLGLDPWLESLLKESAPKARLLKSGDRVPTRALDAEHSGDSGPFMGDEAAIDPHVWLDPQRARLIVRAIGEELSRVDPPHATAYRDRATEVDRSLEELDKELAARTMALPRRSLVTFHAGFGYFAERYGLEILAILEPSPGTAPTEAHLAGIRAILRDRKVPALYSEPQLDPGPAKRLSEEARIPLGVLDPVGGGPETDRYEKLLRHNVAQLEKLQR